MESKLNSYQFLYWSENNLIDDRISIVKAKNIISACGIFIRSKKNIQYIIRIDYEVLDMSSDQFIDISEIKSVENFIN